MKWSSKLFTVLVALIVLTFLPSVIVSNPSPGDVLTTLAIDVGSSAARLSALIGVNGFAFGDTGKPRIILTGPGTHSSPGPLKSNWTSEGFLLIKDGTDEAHYVHAFNTLFNLDHPIEMRSRDKYSYHNRPNITGYQAFSLIDITGKYMEKLKTSAESIVGHTIDFVAIVLPNGRNLRTATKNIINDRRWGNFTSYVRVYVDGNDPQKTKGVMNSATMPLQVSNTVELYERASAAIFSFDNGMEYRRPFLVYRLGSSTFEVSIHDVEGGKFNTISSVYDQRLGGNNFNQRVVDRLLLAHKNKTGQDLSGDDMFLLRLRSEVENAKQSLSVRDRVLIEIEPLQTGGEGLSEVLTRSQFEEFNMDLFNKTITAIDRAIKDSTMYTKDDIQDVVFSGGSANIPFSSRPLKSILVPIKNTMDRVTPKPP
ncbi:hypothetical protein EMPS_03743 [Entomortierella parvispora]|uniref:Uncharacterized protein n=1 Tax=Entomortierella parvispora TaxID=205924 RepID=A0A9P3LUT7_9FUNG|nr:hypothetical protein EMPS_03743 [Entomortierella parvispora]